MLLFVKDSPSLFRIFNNSGVLPFTAQVFFWVHLPGETELMIITNNSFDPRLRDWSSCFCYSSPMTWIIIVLFLEYTSVSTKSSDCQVPNMTRPSIIGKVLSGGKSIERKCE